MSSLHIEGREDELSDMIGTSRDAVIASGERLLSASMLGDMFAQRPFCSHHEREWKDDEKTARQDLVKAIAWNSLLDEFIANWNEWEDSIAVS